jgi:hypothetical protein
MNWPGCRAFLWSQAAFALWRRARGVIERCGRNVERGET